METILGVGNLLVDSFRELLHRQRPFRVLAVWTKSPMTLQVFFPLKQWKLFITLEEWFSNFSMQKNHFGIRFFFQCSVPIPSPLKF